MESIIPDVPEKSRWLMSQLAKRGHRVRGRGLMLGIEMDHALQCSRALLRMGFIALPAGERGEVLGVTPPLTITNAQLTAFLDALDQAVQ